VIAAIVAALPAIINLILLIVNSVKQTPEEKRVEFVNALADSIKKAKYDKNPEDLARLISKL